jgi:hypothetical protein
LFPTAGRVCVWRTFKETYNPECLVPAVKDGGGSVTIWAAISWYSAGPVITMSGRIAASDYVDVLGNQVHPVVQMLYDVFHDDYSPIHVARSVQSWFEEHEDTLHHLLWLEQSPNLNIIEPLWSVLESTVRSRFPRPSSLKQLEEVLHEVWYSTPLETIQNLRKSIPRRIQAGGPTPF